MAFDRKSREAVDDVCRLGRGICKWCEKFLVPVIIGSGPRESKYNLTVGRLVIHQFWRRAQDTHIHTQRHTAVCAGLQKHRKMLCQTLTLLADAPTTGHPLLEPLLASIWPKETGLIFYLACSENLPQGTPLRPVTMGK